VCTVFGLAFHLYDPDGLLGDKKHVGITCALVPYDHPGVDTGRRHFPLNAMFMNGPTRGKDVFMPLDFIIGGPKMAGQGWRMLMECLAAGRSISLPSSNAGMAQMTARSVGGYARVRSQFKMAVGKFEGVEEALTRIGAYTYMMDATRTMTAGAVDLGEKPSVVSAIAKYHVTERARQVVNDGMDIVGGKGICLGPSNFLGRAYQQVPVAITVEGANILTRSLIIFGQGAIRCHPYLLPEMQAAQNKDVAPGFGRFRQGTVGPHRLHHQERLPCPVAGHDRFALRRRRCRCGAGSRRYYQQMTRFSAAFAFLSDISLLVLGGSVKRREKLSARLGDILAQMYLISCTLKRFETDGRQAADLPLVNWAIWDAMYKAQEAFDGVIANFPNRFIGAFLHRSIFPWGHPYVVPSDDLGHKVAKLLIEPSAARDRLTAECFLPMSESEPVGAIELALIATLEAEAIEAKIREAEKAGRFANNPLANVRDIAIAAVECGVITAAEFEKMQRRNALRDIVVHVDDFPFDFNVATANKPAPERKAA
jgi:acyl-CoA dehydrogenase